MLDFLTLLFSFCCSSLFGLDLLSYLHSLFMFNRYENEIFNFNLDILCLSKSEDIPMLQVNKVPRNFQKYL